MRRVGLVMLFGALGAAAATGSCGDDTVVLVPPADATVAEAAAAPEAAAPDASEAGDASALDASAEAGDASPPDADAGEPPVRFAVIGDYGSGSGRELAVANMVLAWKPDFIVTTGDNNYGTAVDSYDPNVGQFYHEYIAPYAGAYGAGAAKNAFFPCIGNHDWDIGGGVPYFDFFELPGNERYFELVKGPAHFVFLDSDAREPDGNTSTSVQGQWAEAAIGAASEPFTFVVLHHPAYTSGSRTPVMDWPFKTWGADAVLTGHVHNYERLVSTDGLVYFVNGQGGRDTHAFGAVHPASKLRYNTLDGAQLVTVTRAKATFRYYAVDGSLIDEYAVDPTGASVPP
ncbi:MAG: metallophosphoesterase [Myxococcales bacterium]|nr:metallophosphoesterase [Myxococcales bacterium]